MQTSPVDPRDQTWEIDKPSFRVHFHDSDRRSDEYEVRDAEVDEVVAWAQSGARGRTFVVYVCVPFEGLGLVRLLGKDPNAT